MVSRHNFKTGNIVRVVIKNFLTFDNVTVYPTPYLNLILGPNGTGKSTILCAICICLGGKTSVTGRSKSIDDYVKERKGYATLEVELYQEDGENPVIMREFGNGIAKWYLQGRQTTKKEIDKVIEKFSIQIDNLCTFLPQDRVASFAKMNPIQLLEATEKAVGEPSLYECHALLCSSGNKIQETRARAAEMAKEIEQLQRQNASMKSMIDNIQEKEKIEDDIRELQQQLTYHRYEGKRQEAVKISDDVKSDKAKLEEEKSMIAPFKEQIEVAKTGISTLNADLNKTIIGVRKCESKCQQYSNQVEELNEIIRTDTFAFESKLEEHTLRQREIQDYQTQLDCLEGQLKNLPVVDEESVNKQIAKLSKQISDLSTQEGDIQNTIIELGASIKRNEETIKKCNAEITVAQDVFKQRMSLLREKNSNAYRAAEWLNKNENMFNSPFYMPMCTLLNIKDPAFVSIVESALSFNDLIAFVFEDKDDMNKFKKQMDSRNIPVNIIHSVPADLSTFPHPVPVGQLRKWRFDRYMSDLIDAPKAVLSYLYKNNRIHMIPISREENIEYEMLPDKLPLFFMGSLRVSRSRSRYDNESITETSKVKVGSLLKITLNQDHIIRLEQEIKELENLNIASRRQKQELEAQASKIKEDMGTLKNEKQAYLSNRDQRKSLVNRIKQKRKQIETKEGLTFDEEYEREQLQNKISQIVKEMMNCVKEARLATNSINLTTQNYYKIKGEIKLRREYMQSQEKNISAKEDEIRNHEASIVRKERLKCKVKEEARDLLTQLCNLLGKRKYDDIELERIKKFRKMTESETEKKLVDLEARRECIHTADENEITDYKQREATIDELQKNLSILKEKKGSQQKRIEESRERWVPCITELINNISTSFSNFMERLGCAGEVELIHDVDEHDYTKYGISIKVKFRGANKLRILTAQHQSGGERAVATALYMLSLQNQTSVPFRCVDEINQGMDPVNERMMLNMMMETAAREDSSQYFFVSPKLLPDLVYSERVNSIVVYNGVVTIPRHKFSVQDTIRKKLRLKRK